MKTKLILSFLAIGILFRLFLTWDGKFLFNMDNARDMVDVREMVVLGKLRLTGPTSAIEGFFNGPAWYYLLAAPFIISGGDPYGSIILQIILWAIGGFFLMRLAGRWSEWLIGPVGAIWVASNYVVLANLYAFNPNPVILLTPLFIYLLFEYLEKGKVLFGILSFILAGLFFNFEMNFGVFTPAIILVNILLTKKFKLLRSKGFWLGVAAFILTLLPQILFDIKHQFIMSKSLVNFLTEGSGLDFNFAERVQIISESFFNTISATFMNHKIFSLIILGLFGSVVLRRWRQLKTDLVVLVCLSIIFIPFLGYLILPVTVNAWHLGAEMVAIVLLTGFLCKEVWQVSLFGKIISPVLVMVLIFYALSNIVNFFVNDFGKINNDPSLYKNEIAAIDFVYKYADSKNFKVYTYIPSIIDYPYQYLIWWHGLKKYGYLPQDYAYSPNKPQYISNKDKFSETPKDLSKRENSNLVFLIKEPDRNFTRAGWEGDFIPYNWHPVEKQIVGSIEVEVMKE